MSADLLRRAATRLREDAAHARAMDEHLDGHDRPYNPADPTDPAVVAERCDQTADLLDALSKVGAVQATEYPHVHIALRRAETLARTILREPR